MNGRSAARRAGFVGAALLLLAGGCQSKYPGTVDRLRQEIVRARDAGARYCAARDFAAAEAYFEFALIEIHEKNFVEADSYLATADRSLRRVRETMGECRSDLDGDGIGDMADASPYRAEDIDGFEDQDGRPDLDNDGDGIADVRDAEPNLPEDLDGFEDADGRPDLDNDGDGIPDQRDVAPGDPEDFDGFEDADGAPEPDNDRDGLADARDLCPNDPETYNSYDDADGCPDVRPVVRKVIMVGRIQFYSGGSRLRPDAFPILKKFAEDLSANPEIRVRIEGHTDDVGDPEANMRLSQERAERVKAVLVGEGVDATRLEAVGLGESRPVTSNATADGRARNRRIDFVILQDDQSEFAYDGKPAPEDQSGGDEQ